MSVAALTLMLLLWILVRRQPKNVVAYATDSGSVMVSRQAIVELVQTSCEQLKDVSKPRVRLTVKGRTTHFEIRLKLLSGGSLRDIEQTLQTHLRQALTDNLGIENLGRINIVAIGFKSGKIAAPLPTKAVPDEVIPEPEVAADPDDAKDSLAEDLADKDPKKVD
jgi:hypothetical protein